MNEASSCSHCVLPFVIPMVCLPYLFIARPSLHIFRSVFVGIDTILIVLPHSNTEVADAGCTTRSTTSSSEVPHFVQPATQPPWFCVDHKLHVKQLVGSHNVVEDP